MSLVISLRVPDGIVAAADSLSTAQSVLELVTGDVKLECPHCKREVSAQQLKLPRLTIPFSASSYTQKLFSLYDTFAIGYSGQGVINNRSFSYHVRQFELQNKEPGNLVETRDKLVAYLEAELEFQFSKYKEKAPKNWRPIGFHINGFEENNRKPIGTTYEVFIGRENLIRKRDMLGCTIGGDTKVVKKLWEIGKQDPRLQFKYGLFSLQDAIDLSEFLISATNTFQRFANEVQTVGGEIDIALLTPFDGFQWIKRKRLMQTLEKKKLERPK